jgi:hypothetical protein
MWTEIFAKYVTDRVAFLVHMYLLAGDVLATWVVAAGILWEHGPADVRKVADRLVIWGVVAETLCSVALFTFDEGISAAQQSKIIALETQLAPRFLDKTQFDAIQSVKGKVKSVYVMPEASVEPQFLAYSLINALQYADVDVTILRSPQGMYGTGIEIWYPDEEYANGHVEKQALTKALFDAGLNPGSGNLKYMLPELPMPRDTPVIFVGEKYPFPVPKPIYIPPPK